MLSPSCYSSLTDTPRDVVIVQAPWDFRGYGVGLIKCHLLNAIYWLLGGIYQTTAPSDGKYMLGSLAQTRYPS